MTTEATRETRPGDAILEGEALERHWDRLYGLQEPGDGFTWSRRPSDFIVELIADLEPRGRQVLDLGCGDGRNLVPFAAAGFSVTGVDISSEALARAKINLERVPGAQWSLVKSDVGALELPRRYDLVISTKLFKHLWGSEAILPRLVGLVGRDGRFVFELATDSDSSRGKCVAHGRRVGKQCFVLGDGTRYRFFSEAEVHNLFEDLAEIEVSRVGYWDEPHRGLGSQERHRHDSWVVSGRTR